MWIRNDHYSEIDSQCFQPIFDSLISCCFTGRRIFSKKDYRIAKRKYIFYSMQWKRDYSIDVEEKNRTINQQVSWRHDAYLHNALHPLERQVVIELHNIYICVSYPCHKLGCIPASWWPWSHFVHRVQFVFNVEGSLGWENR